LILHTIIRNPCKVDLFGNCGKLESIQQIGEQQPSLLVPVWKRAQDLPRIGENGLVMTLYEIENLLRDPPLFGPGNYTIPREPLVHACIVAGTVSSPDLWDRTYTPNTLNRVMKDRMKNFLNNTEKGLVMDLKNGVLKLSTLFGWNKREFTQSSSLIDFLVPYVTHKVALEIAKGGQFDIQYLDYNWDLNGNVGDLCQSVRTVCFPWWALLIALMGTIIIALTVCIVRRQRSDRHYGPSLIQ